MASGDGIGTRGFRRRADQRAQPATLIEVRERPASLVVVGGLILAGLLVLGLSLWLVPRSLARLAPPAAPGVAVALPGGTLRVDRLMVAPAVPVAPGAGNRIGMERSFTGGDVTPPGFRRIVVEITLSAESEAGLRYSADQFWLTGTGLRALGPHRHQLGAGWLPAGQTIAGQLVFQAPSEATTLALNVSGGARPIALPLDVNGVSFPPPTD